MKKIIIAFLFFGVFLSVSYFGVEYLSDMIFNDTRGALKSEIIRSIIVGGVTALLLVIANRKSLRKGKR
ncbi:hypothetical protein EV201_1643 [Ancylomarina subtilis]|uniref:Uncharacterized protein n=1 Tax=Ancylomarina subtilis TaxID=1639035 RepID=A0A4Q7VLJ6_9BACT|nr:hypothetical protein [Ancylomarina subtilis]RZT96987.1 hypothetical protein EV201_1643 [Ancylomarina subtilis]